MTRGSIAKAVRLQKEAHPERFCTQRDCLHRAPCPKLGHHVVVQPQPVAVLLDKAKDILGGIER